ncbi:glucan endo-1,3-beta-glucosidase 1-like [Rosa rugosa]|uniref:glucan endo-1,3-beta-glucosidase 1-like n=1 Tax=Rosa rugosa TaxID=74645 RepID=UPI002B4049D2|nr:glucan endo-1,3-beta-glucosidase 1-like [Rosa rugosa]XP_062012790.1 glucan endo-1,3-beta-glucosidase 1-like [Rosa rugosa]XP_062012791.1 glucan endo-1,3-beta-glucosidase 1-like [Rosa rugosa]XP_062012792.1 glucan endo-1,3-beta-glucosidase 1-like [Rosa rugosa]XP_062012793.1 glucan endo-1,3-beta-glucosidase 1-like [Rosa rugosa]
MSSSRLYMRILLGVIICLGQIHISPLKAFAQTWCVANPSLGYDTSENVESYACNYVDCSSIHSGDPCSVPSNLFSRASFAMDAYYQQGHDCTFGGSGLKSITDPSYGNCKFVGSEEMISAPAALSKWCIAKPTAPYSLLQMNIDFACSQVDCSVIQTGGECQLPDTIMNHASVAMNLYYQSFGRTDLSCYFKSTGMIVIDDPSFGTCLYKRKGKEGGAGVSLVKKHGKSSVILKLIVASIITFGLVGTVTVVCVCRRSRNPSQAIKSEMQHMPTPAPSQSQPQPSCSVTVSVPCEAVSVPLSPPPGPSQTQPKKDDAQLDIGGNYVARNHWRKLCGGSKQ